MSSFPSPSNANPPPINPGSHSSSSSSPTPSPTRPNRWTGAPSTWASLTSQERGLAASLDSLRNADLSLHLYNAYILKKRARDVRIGSVKVEDEFKHLPEEDRVWEPPRYWTTWPLRPEDVPREGEKVGPEDGDERYTFRRVEMEREMPSAILEELLVGTTLRIAKERFLGRGEAGKDERVLVGDDEDETEVVGKAGSGDRGPGGSSVLANKNGNTGMNQEVAHSEEEPLELVIQEASEPPQPEILLKPVVSADDDRSRELLRPSTRHTLSRLDEVLMALHHARKTCRQYSHQKTDSDDETPMVEEEPTTPIKKPVGRPRKFANLPDRSRSGEGSQSQATDDTDLFRAKKTHRGRPQKVYERLEGESQYDYLIRISRIQKKPLPAFAPPRETLELPEPGRSGKSPVKRATEEEKEKDRQRRIRPRDWSEVLGAAALVGFPSEVIARATQRCANLFGESMSMRSMVEMPFSKESGDGLTHYQPQAIPDFRDEEVIESSESDDLDGSSSELNSEKMHKARSKRPIKLGQALLRQTCFCPLPDCPRKTRGFIGIGKLKKHLQRGHQIAKDELDEYMLPSDEEMDGAVHVDGFLKPLKQRGGPRGKYKKEGKRSRDESEEDESEEQEEELTSITKPEMKELSRSVGRAQTADEDSSDN